MVFEVLEHDGENNRGGVISPLEFLWCVLERRESRKEYFPFKPGNAYHKSRLSLVNTKSKYGSCRLLPPWTDPYSGLDTVSEVQE